jgi:hypothetical protein
MEIKPAQLAKIAGLKRQAIYNAIRRGNIISNTAGLVDTQNKINSEWIKNHGVSENDIKQYLIEIQKKQVKQKKVKSMSGNNPKIKPEIKQKAVEIGLKTINDFENIKENEDNKKDIDELDFEDISGLPSRMMNLKLFQLVKRYGGPLNLTNWALILQRVMSAQEKEQKIKERRLELIEKDFVISRLMVYLEILSNQLFDYTESAPIKIISLVKSEVDNIELDIKKEMRKDFSILIKDTKERINTELEDLKRKYEKSNDSNN